MEKNIAVAAALLLGTANLAHAQGTHAQGSMGGGAAGSPGASQLSPGGDADDRGPGALGSSLRHEMNEPSTIGQSRGNRGDLDRDGGGLEYDRGGRQSFGHDSDDHRTTGQSRSGRDIDRGRGDRDRGASDFSPGSRMHGGGGIDRR